MNYQISEKRYKYLIMNIIRTLDIDGLYRVQFTSPLKQDGTYVVALFMDTVTSSDEQRKIKDEVSNTLKNILNFDDLVIIIPYSEAKYHLREPRNI